MKQTVVKCWDIGQISLLQRLGVHGVAASLKNSRVGSFWERMANPPVYFHPKHYCFSSTALCQQVSSPTHQIISCRLSGFQNFLKKLKVTKLADLLSENFSSSFYQSLHEHSPLPLPLYMSVHLYIHLGNIHLFMKNS